MTFCFTSGGRKYRIKPPACLRTERPSMTRGAEARTIASCSREATPAILRRGRRAGQRRSTNDDDDLEYFDGQTGCTGLCRRISGVLNLDLWQPRPRSEKPPTRTLARAAFPPPDHLLAPFRLATTAATARIVLQQHQPTAQHPTFPPPACPLVARQPPLLRFIASQASASLAYSYQDAARLAPRSCSDVL